MLKTTENKNSLFAIGIISYTALLVLACFFYQERTLWGDLAFHFFYIINDNSYAIQNERFGAFITQSVPLFGSRLGLSIQSIAVLYSCFFVIYYFLVFLISFKVLKNTKIALTMLLLNTLMVGHTFFWIQSEYPQGLAMMLLFFGLITKSPDIKDYSKIELLLIIPLVITIVYFHPLIFIPFLFICFFLYVDKNNLTDKKLLVACLFLFVLVRILKETIFKKASVYEANALSGLGKFYNFFPDYLTLQNNSYFAQLLFSNYCFLPILLAIITYWYFREKLFLKLSLVWLFFVSYLLLINVVYEGGAFVYFYMENMYLPLSLFVIVPFIFDYFPTRTIRQQQMIIVGIVLVALVRIPLCSTGYSQRLEWEQKILAETKAFKQKKIIIPTSTIPKNILQNSDWATPYEFWLLSAIENPNEMRSIMVHPNPHEFDHVRISCNNCFITYWGNFPYSNFSNKKYLNFTDTTFYTIYHPL